MTSVLCLTTGELAGKSYRKRKIDDFVSLDIAPTIMRPLVSNDLKICWQKAFLICWFHQSMDGSIPRETMSLLVVMNVGEARQDRTRILQGPSEQKIFVHTEFQTRANW